VYVGIWLYDSWLFFPTMQLCLFGCASFIFMQYNLSL
jgi:hypothetical protein